MSEDDLAEENIWEYKSIAKPKAEHQNSEPIFMNVQVIDYGKGKLQRNDNRKTPEEKESTKGSSQRTKHFKPNQPFCVYNENPVMQVKEDVSSASAKQSHKKKTSDVKEAHGRGQQGSRQKTKEKVLKQPVNVSDDHHVAQSQEGALSPLVNQKNCKKQSHLKTRPVYEGYCPSCQMPFSLLLIQTPQWHVMECLDDPETTQKECPDGLLCTSTFPSHYKRYSHFLLAASRAGEYVADLSLSSIENNFISSGAAPSISSGAFSYEVLQDLPRQCLPLPKQSFLATNSDINAFSSKNSTDSSLRIHSTNVSKQVESSGHRFQKTESNKELDSKLNTLIPEVDLSDCDISYSPLNSDNEEVTETEEEAEVAATINNFPKSPSESSNLTDKIGKNGNFNKPPSASKLTDFNNNSVKITQSCTTNYESSETLNMLRNINGTSIYQGSSTKLQNTVTDILDQLSKDSNLSAEYSGTNAAFNTVQAAPTRVLKQMDIGVFFGLQPKAKMESDQKKNPSEATQTLSPLCATGKRSRPRKRKAEELVGELDITSESPSKNKDPASSEQKRWTKRFRESCPVEEVNRRKQCPFYKRIPGTEFVIDAFQYGEVEGCKGYFLTHFHSDHYGGLTKKFTFPIYCNKITGNLVKSKLQVQEQYIHVLPMNKECIINGIKVVLLDANHCPGAAMILFSFPNGSTVLHTGDFRADPSMERCPFLIGREVHTLYLDTTYCNPEYTFPSQQEVIQFAVNTAFETVTLHPRTLVICGTYSIGKEKVFLAIAEVLGSKVSMSQEKYKTLKCLESSTINSLITLDWNNTLLHLLPMMQINFKGLERHLNKFSENFDRILAFKPTGWTYSDRCCSLTEIQPQTRGKITIYGIPYSEHSSFLEMKRFVQWLKPQKIIPTVNVGNWKSRNQMEKYFRDWKMEVPGWN